MTVIDTLTAIGILAGGLSLAGMGAALLALAIGKRKDRANHE